MREIVFIKTPLALLLLLFIINVQAQQNFQTGYIVSSKGDTIAGQINFREWETNPRRIEFRQNESTRIISYTPMEIRNFTVAGENYASGVVSVDKSPFKLSELTYFNDFKFENDTVFLEELFMGEKPLYYYKEMRGKENFYIKKENAYELLVLKEYLENADDRVGVRSNRAYIDQLELYLQDCSNINKLLLQTEYKKESMQKLFEKYYACRNLKPQFQKVANKTKAELGVLAGLTLTKLAFTSDINKALAGSEYPMSSSITAAFFYNFYLSRNLKKWSMNTELMYSSYKTDGYFEEHTDENTYKTVNTSFGYSYLKLNLMGRYNYAVSGDFKIYFNAGVSNGVVVSEKNYKKEVSVFYTTETIREGRAMESTKKYEPGYLLGMGGKLKSFLIESRFEKTIGMSAYSSINSKVSRFHFLIGYQF